MTTRIRIKDFTNNKVMKRYKKEIRYYPKKLTTDIKYILDQLR